MPHFNKGVFHGVRYEAKPISKFRTISSIFRWYMPYSPGKKIDFAITLESIDGQTGGFTIKAYDENRIRTWLMDIDYTPNKKTTRIPLAYPGRSRRTRLPPRKYRQGK
jgi:hypothetical protein